MEILLMFTFCYFWSTRHKNRRPSVKKFKPVWCKRNGLFDLAFWTLDVHIYERGLSSNQSYKRKAFCCACKLVPGIFYTWTIEVLPVFAPVTHAFFSFSTNCISCVLRADYPLWFCFPLTCLPFFYSLGFQFSTN